MEIAIKNASHVVNYLIGRAIGTTKTGDAPYRVLLDIFVEDFISVLGLPEWPGAELVLQQVLKFCVSNLFLLFCNANSISSNF